ncbi:biogenesis of lysosome-related organelles complex 1 subunit 2-like [Petaurus breviceps papuanus]|uniref:biogenesis of lysosome-related organelles complex 1 subunit 2-like n=1 Tax=Petaurus breviceps papuanus TaxID=3040969 RepID=UPI0036D8379F
MEPAQADIMGLCQDMFSKMAMYLRGELTATSEEYKLMENMNKLTSLKYLEMKDIGVNISRNLKDLSQKYTTLQPYLDQITLVEEQVAALQQAAYKLDAYSMKLEAKYKKLERRCKNSLAQRLKLKECFMRNMWDGTLSIGFSSQKEAVLLTQGESQPCLWLDV